MNHSRRLIASATVVGLLALHMPWCALGKVAGDPGVLSPGTVAGGGSCCRAHSANDGVADGAPADPGGSPGGDPCCPGGCKGCPRTCCGGAPLLAALTSQSIAIDGAAHGAVTLREPHLQSISAAGIFHPPRA